ncbi:hypothetical protein ACFVIY_17990 [Streptomyces sp. NPDC127166]|uniref:DNA polymerase III subunit beta family protein n=1 Tax=Streptomyces sp. NPDC127166 TaxID=3345380 RepID=UPI00362D1E9F
MTTILANDLQRMLKQVAPHVSSDETLPTLTAVHLESRDGYLYAASTDRYTMAIARQPVLNEGEWKASILNEHLASLTAWLKTESSTTIKLSADDETLTLSGPSNSITLKTLTDHITPDWRKYLRQHLDTEVGPVPLSGVTAKYLGRWKDAAQMLHVWQASPSAPLIFMDRAGEFIGMQMPTKDEHTTRDGLIDAWSKSLTRYATVGDIRFNLDEDMVDRDGDPWTYSGKDLGREPLVHLLGIEDDTFTLSTAVNEFGLRPAA